MLPGLILASCTVNCGVTVTGTVIIANLQSLACSGSLQLMSLSSFPIRAFGLSVVLFIERMSHNIHADIAQMVNHAKTVKGFHIKSVMPSIGIAKPKIALPPPVLDATSAFEAL